MPTLKFFEQDAFPLKGAELKPKHFYQCENGDIVIVATLNPAQLAESLADKYLLPKPTPVHERIINISNGIGGYLADNKFRVLTHAEIRLYTDAQGFEAK